MKFVAAIFFIMMLLICQKISELSIGTAFIIMFLGVIVSMLFLKLDDYLRDMENDDEQIK